MWDSIGINSSQWLFSSVSWIRGDERADRKSRFGRPDLAVPMSLAVV